MNQFTQKVTTNFESRLVFTEPGTPRTIGNTISIDPNQCPSSGCAHAYRSVCEGIHHS